MSTSGSPPPTREVKFIPETPPPIPQSLESSQEHVHLSKKPRNYKYWSDDEVKKILRWLTLPENEGKLARNKAQACREVAKKLFDGDEYMAISVRSKLMSLEKGFKEAEQLRLQLNSSTNDETLINDRIKEISKFHKECNQLFGNNRRESFNGTASTSPIASSSSLPTPSNSIPFSPLNNNNRYQHSQQQRQPQRHPYYQRLSPPPTASSSSSLPLPFPSSSSSNHPDLDHQEYSSANNNNSDSQSLLPHLNEERLSALSIPPPIIRGSWSLPRVSTVDFPSVGNDENEKKKKENSTDMSSESRVRIAKYAAKQASYAARQAEFEALKSEHEQSKMEFAIRLAEIELDREALSIKKLELELELLKSKDSRA